ncbi:unnamed protein product [Gongylonema pulchrum]|uniref:V-SNARE coiled-coil homology domain-containing protein n=1 Tax=Gongylonema pulchrum TaxID=637853 RepID=A0A183EGP6_9BILA|nr:unnamed protein product [Gongylonema pulchrum]
MSDFLNFCSESGSLFQEGASQFEKSAATLKRKYWWKNIKMIIIMCAILVVLIIFIIIWASNNGFLIDRCTGYKMTFASGHDWLDLFHEGASQFEKSAATLKRKYWWKNIKMIIIIESSKR